MTPTAANDDLPGEDGTAVVGAGPAGVARAAALIRAGGVVAFPTETVYGLGADAGDDRAVAAIFAAKDRPRFNPLIVHVADPAAAEAVARFDDRAHRLAETLWPGPLTLVLPRQAGAEVAPGRGVSLLVSAGLDSVAVRVPAHPVAQALLRAAGRPIAAPSANRSGEVSPTTAQHVRDSLDGRIPLILAGGRAEVGLESTVVDLTGPVARLLRPGAVTAETLAAILGEPVETGAADAPAADAPADAAGADRPRAPGQLASHYAPRARVRLHARAAEPDEALLTFGPDLRSGPRVANLSETGDLVEAAANLFAHLRRLDTPEVAGIAVVDIPEEGLGAAINDRLRRAAAPRPGDDAG
jgi:L-threonylcarbamoyladenylate synthase